MFKSLNQRSGEKRHYVIYICVRNYGDALVQAAMISSLMSDHLEDVLVICKKSTGFIFDERKIKYLLLPENNFNPLELISFIYSITKIRSSTYCFFGDIRERLISLFFIRSKVFVPKWPNENYLNKVLRIKGPLFHAETFPLKNFNIYQDFKDLVIFSKNTAGLLTTDKVNLNLPYKRNIKRISIDSKEKRISLQLMGSIREKIIPHNLVVLIVEKLLRDGYGINFIGDEMQIAVIKNNFGDDVRCGMYFYDSFDKGKQAISSSIGFIGVDSFWAHYAISESIPAFIFTGGFPSDAIYPKETKTFSLGSACSAFPCNSHSICFSGDDIPLSCFGNGNSKLLLEEVDKFTTSLSKTKLNHFY